MENSSQLYCAWLMRPIRKSLKGLVRTSHDEGLVGGISAAWRQRCDVDHVADSM